MYIIQLIIRQNLIMFFYMMIGFCLYKNGMVTEQGSAEMGKLLLYVIMPAAIFKSYVRDFSGERMTGFLVSFLAALAALALSMAISRLIFRKRSGVRQFGAAFSNAGFMGIPLVQMTLGEEAVFYAASFVALLNILQWTYGVFIMTGERSVIQIRKLLTNPVILSFTAGMLIFFLPVTVPEILVSFCSALAGMNGPLAMIVLGIYLAQLSLRELFTDRQAYICAATRLLFIPFLTACFFCLIPSRYHEIQMTLLILASAPVGSNAAVFAQLYGKKYRDAVKDVCLSTVFCVATMPLIIAFFQGIRNHI